MSMLKIKPLSPTVSIKGISRESLDTTLWPAFDRPCLGPPSEKNIIRTRFESLERALFELYDGADLKSTAKRAQMSGQNLSNLVWRCLEKAPDGQIYGFRALVSGCRIRQYVRQAGLNLDKGSAGAAGVFAALLREHPTIQRAVDDAIQNVKPPGRFKWHTTSNRIVFQAFVSACKEAGLTKEMYPFCTKTVGKRSLHDYTKRKYNENLNLVREWFGEAAMDRQKLGAGLPAFFFARKPYDLVYADAHLLDCHSSVEIDLPDGRNARMAVTRMWLVVLLDAKSNAVLGYSLTCASQIKAEHVEEALLCAMTPWKPRKLVDGLSYKANACLPHGAVPGVSGCPIVMLRLDNASQHHSERIEEIARQAIGMHVQFGAVGASETNAQLERFFRTLEELAGLHRVPSTTGSGHQDEKRPKNFVRNAVDKKVDFQYIRDLVEVGITEHNATPSSGHSNLSPREIVHQSCNHGRSRLLRRRRTPRHLNDLRMGWKRFEQTIGGRSQQGRNPWIEIYGRRYTAPYLANREFIGDKVVVYMNIRTSEVMEIHHRGRLVPDFYLMGRKQPPPMALEDLQAMNSEKNRAYISEDVGLEAVRAQLLNDAVTTHERDRYKVSGPASMLVAAFMRDQLAHDEAEKAAPYFEMTDVERDVATEERDRALAEKIFRSSARPERTGSTKQHASEENPLRPIDQAVLQLPMSRRPSFDNLTNKGRS